MSESVIDRSPDVMGGTPVFAGTRVPVRTLIDYIETGETIDGFLEDFPTVGRDQLLEVLEVAKRALAAEKSDGEGYS